MKRNRLTDNDVNLGPITIGAPSKHWRPIGITLASGCEEYPGCSLNLYLGWRSVRLAMPQVVKPWRQWKDMTQYAWASGPGYWDIHPKEYGFRLSDGFLQVFLGAQTGDSTTEKSWSTHLPWTQWRHVRHSMYGLHGEHVWTEATKPRRNWDDWHTAKEQCPKVRFVVQDYDGARIVAATHIEEREWHFGEKWCSWLSVFRKPRISRSLDISFEKAVGRDKGSWKGGLMGIGIEMLPGELHEAAFRRFCALDVRSKNGASKLAFVGKA